MTILCLVPGFPPPSSLLLQPGRRLSWIPNNLAIIGLLEGAKCGCGAGVVFVFLMKDYKIWAEAKCRLLRMQSEFDMRTLPVDKSRKGAGRSHPRRIQGGLHHHVPNPPQVEPQPTQDVRGMLNMKKKYKKEIASVFVMWCAGKNKNKSQVDTALITALICYDFDGPCLLDVESRLGNIG